MNVLLVDDDKFNLDLVYDMLQGSTVTVVGKASDGLEAYEYYLKNTDKIDLIITDWCMPLCDGLTLCGMIKDYCSEYEIPAPKIILQTGSNISEARADELIRDGIGAVLRKPYKTIDLVKAIEKVKIDLPA